MVFDYPIQPSTEKWRELNSKEEKFQACQIPKYILENMKTEELLNVVLAYPLLYDIFAYNNLHQGFEYLVKNFNGLNELFKRKELTKKVLNFYSKEKTNENGEKRFKIIFLEVLITYPKIYDMFSKSEKIELENISILKKREKEKINCWSYNFLDIYKNLTTYVQTTVTSVKTPNGSKVEVYSDLEELSEYEKAQIDLHFKSSYPKALCKSSSTMKYNCHSYAWYSQDVKNNKYWMNSPEQYIKDKSYIEEAMQISNNKIIYISNNIITHSGIITQKDEMISKWGRGPLMVHQNNDSPYTEKGYKLKEYKKNDNDEL